MKKKRVLIIAANDMGNSGVPGVYMQIVRSLSDSYLFDIVITRENYYYRDEFLSYGGKIFLLPERKYQNPVKRLFWRMGGLKRYIFKEMLRILKINKYDIIHSFKENESWMYFEPAKKSGVAKRILHNNRKKERFNSFILNRLQSRYIKKSLKLSTDNISISTECGKSFFGANCFSVIYNAFDSTKFKFNDSNSKSEDLNLLQVGTFLPLKNQLFTLDVIKKLTEEYPKLHMTFIGKPYDIKYFKSFKMKIEKLNLQNNVTILDYDIDQRPIISKTTFCLIPSLEEGLSLTAIEGQACGITVFASKGVPEEVNIGNIVFLELNPDVWAKEIDIYFSKNKNNRKEIDTSKFSTETFKNKLLSVYENN